MASALEVIQQEAEDATTDVQTIKIKMVGAEGSQEEATELRMSLATEEERYVRKYQEVEKYRRHLESEYTEQWKQEMSMMERSLTENCNIGASEAQEQVQAARSEIKMQKETRHQEAMVTEEAIHQRQAIAHQEFEAFEAFEASRTKAFEESRMEAVQKFEEE